MSHSDWIFISKTGNAKSFFDLENVCIFDHSCDLFSKLNFWVVFKLHSSGTVKSICQSSQHWKVLIEKLYLWLPHLNLLTFNFNFHWKPHLTIKGKSNRCEQLFLTRGQFSCREHIFQYCFGNQFRAFRWYRTSRHFYWWNQSKFYISFSRNAFEFHHLPNFESKKCLSFHNVIDKHLNVDLRKFTVHRNQSGACKGIKVVCRPILVLKMRL